MFRVISSRCSPVAAFHSLTVRSCDADASRWPSGENATAVTLRLWPSSVWLCSPVAAFHSLTVRSCDADASRRPSGENATAVTQLPWPSSVCSSRLQADWTFGNLRIQVDLWSLNLFLMILVSGAKIIAEEYS
jgi:hypothetical protein